MAVCEFFKIRCFLGQLNVEMSLVTGMTLIVCLTPDRIIIMHHHACADMQTAWLNFICYSELSLHSTQLF